MKIIEIKAKYKKLHDDLTEAHYKGHELSKEDFDIQHAKIWDDCEVELKTASDYVEPIPPRDLIAEMETLKARIEKLEKM